MRVGQLARKVSVAVAVLGVALFALAPTQKAHAASITFNATRNCDDNAVVYCGAMTIAELQQKYGGAGVADVYKYFGITSTDISGMGDNTVAGQVTKSGDVIVDGKTVATGANTAGRTDISGSKQVTQGDTTFYTRATSAALLDDKLDAFVVMSNGEFKFAILASCGNPVAATAKKDAPVPTPAPAAPVPAPTTPSTPTTATPQATTPTPSPSAVTDSNLPNTGAGDVIGVFIGVAIAATAAYKIMSRKREFSL